MTREFCDNYRFLSRYNRWINERLYEACEALTDEARKQERGAFFGSIHRTLGHLVLADQVWLRRFAQCGADNGISFSSLGPDVLDMLGAVAFGLSEVAARHQVLVHAHGALVLAAAAKQVAQREVELGGVRVALHRLDEGVYGLVLLLIEQEVQALEIGLGRLAVFNAQLPQVQP